MTVYFPLVVHGAMLIEPTESELKQSLDQFIAQLRGLAEAAKAGDAPLQGGAALRPAPAPRRDQGGARAATALDADGGAQGGRGVAELSPDLSGFATLPDWLQHECQSVRTRPSAPRRRWERSTPWRASSASTISSSA